jgi:hypothetical protein
MQTSAAMIWRFVRRELAGALLRRPGGLAQLLPPSRRGELSMMFHRDLGIVLENLIAGVRVRDSAAWLHDADLPDEALAEMGLSRQAVDEEFQEERAFQVIRELAQLLQPIPLVFCLDQVEALQKHPDDKAGIFALGKLVATLHDMLRNAAIVCCVQTSFIDQIKATVRGSDQDRMLRNRAGLAPLDWDQAMALLQARLHYYPEVRFSRPPDAPPHWPLDVEKLKGVFDQGGHCLARKVLHRARELFDDALHTQPQADPLEAYLARSFDERLRIHPPEDSDHILRDALPSLCQLLGMPPEDAAKSPRSGGAFDLVVEQSGRPVAIAVCNQRPGAGLVNRFRKIGEKWDRQSVPRLILLRDARLGIGVTAISSRQRLNELRERSAQFVSVSPEAVAALDALRSLLADEGSGDLSHGGEPVTRGAVEQWLLANVPEPLEELVTQLKGGLEQKTDADCSHLLPGLTAFLNERKVVSVSETAQELKASAKEVTSCARQNPVLFALLDGPDPVLFQPVRQSSAT